jgi:hypothetical protein
MSWSRAKNGSAPSPPKETASPAAVQEEIPNNRARAVTTSSYASTATPPKLNDDKDLGLSLGGDFGDMFSGFGKRKSQVLDVGINRAHSRSPVSTLSFNAGISSDLLQEETRTTNLYVDKNIDLMAPVASPFSVASQTSNDGLMGNVSPPPVPQHSSTMPFSRPQKPGDGLRRSSNGPKRQSTLEHGDAIDEDARLLRESVNASRRMNDPSYSRARDSWINPSPSSRTPEQSSIPSWKAQSVETTPRATKVEPNTEDEDLFDSSIYASASTAQRFQEKSSSPPVRPSNAPRTQSKIMTPQQFERYRQDQDRLKMVGGQSKTEDGSDDEEINYDDEDDDTEKNRQLAKQRRKQEAHMAVYRQQMMKVTGESASVAPPPVRASVFASHSSPNLASTLGKSVDEEEEDEEIPLGILQAHGFPNKNRLPMRNSGSNPNLRGLAQSTAGGVVDPRLPVFARKLPEDPYFGAGIVNHPPRESMAFNTGGGSVYGGPSRGLPPGGLVGVIASEERSRASRRGSPNAQGEYAPVPPMGSMVNGMPAGMPIGPMGMGQMGSMGQMPMMPMLTPGDQAQMQMNQQMQQFMQMQMQFMQMMTAPGGQQPGSPQTMGSPQLPQMNSQMSQQSLSVPRPNSPQVRAGNSQQQHQRAMTMMDANAAPWMQQGHGSMYAPSMLPQGMGYAPSIAPSERSNIGLPGRYRPVSHVVTDNKSRTSTMSGALGGWNSENKAPSATVRTVKNAGNASDEDDEEGWGQMAKKREQKKSNWRTKKDSSNGLKEMLGYTQ